MTLSELKKIVSEATSEPWVLEEHGTYTEVVSITANSWGRPKTICCNTQYYPTAADTEDMRFFVAARTMLPKLIKVAEAAQNAFLESIAALPDATLSKGMLELSKALSDLEAE